MRMARGVEIEDGPGLVVDRGAIGIRMMLFVPVTIVEPVFVSVPAR